MWKPKERKIFRYWNGEKECYADPMKVFRMVANLEIDIEATESKAALGDAGAIGDIIDSMRKILNIPEYTEEDGKAKGLLDDEVLQIYRDFAEFSQDKKKDTKQKPNSQKHTQESSGK